MAFFEKTGKTPRGSRPGPPMPTYTLTHEDAEAIVAFLKSLPDYNGYYYGCMSRIVIASLIASAGLLAQTRDPEASKLEITGSWWSIDSSGTIRANGSPIDLKSDLGVVQQQSTSPANWSRNPAGGITWSSKERLSGSMEP